MHAALLCTLFLATVIATHAGIKRKWNDESCGCQAGRLATAQLRLMTQMLKSIVVKITTV